MSSFEKFMEDLEKRQQERKQRLERLKAAEDAHAYRDRVDLYSEYWQNSVRYNTDRSKK